MEDKQKVLLEIAEKTIQIQKLFEECIKLAQENKVEFKAGLTVPKELTAYESPNTVYGSFRLGDEKYNEPDYWRWQNSSLNC